MKNHLPSECAGLPPVTQTDPSDDGQTLRGVLWCLDTGYWCWILSVLLLVFREQALQCRLIVWCLVCNSVYSISACWKSFQINARTYCSTRSNFFFLPYPQYFKPLTGYVFKNIIFSSSFSVYFLPIVLNLDPCYYTACNSLFLSLNYEFLTRYKLWKLITHH